MTDRLKRLRNVGRFPVLVYIRISGEDLQNQTARLLPWNSSFDWGTTSAAASQLIMIWPFHALVYVLQTVTTEPSKVCNDKHPKWGCKIARSLWWACSIWITQESTRVGVASAGSEKRKAGREQEWLLVFIPSVPGWMSDLNSAASLRYQGRFFLGTSDLKVDKAFIWALWRSWFLSNLIQNVVSGEKSTC